MCKYLFVDKFIEKRKGNYSATHEFARIERAEKFFVRTKDVSKINLTISYFRRRASKM